MKKGGRKIFQHTWHVKSETNIETEHIHTNRIGLTQ